MQIIPSTVCNDIIAMKQADIELTNAIHKSGELEKYGYHPHLEKLHLKNGQQLKDIIDIYGFPTCNNSNEEIMNSAWFIVQHCISNPSFMRMCNELFLSYSYEEIPLKERAYLSDRIAFYERKPQLFGTQFDYNLKGYMSVWWLKNRAETNSLRRKAKLPLLSKVEKMYASYPTISVEKAKQMRDEQEKWLVNVGWCTLQDIKVYKRSYKE